MQKSEREKRYKWHEKLRDIGSTIHARRGIKKLGEMVGKLKVLPKSSESWQDGEGEVSTPEEGAHMMVVTPQILSIKIP